MDRKGSISVWIAIMMPTCIMLLGLLIEVGNWNNHKLKLHRTADTGAIAGLLQYKTDRPPANPEPTAENNAKVAAKFLVQVNTGLIPTLVFTSGVNASMQVTISETVPMLFLLSRPSVTMTVTGKAAMVSCSDYVVDPCAAGETTHIGIVE